MAQQQEDIFDSAVASLDGVPGVAEQPADIAAQSAFDFACAMQTPPSVSRGFLAQLGLDDLSPPALFLEFDLEDLNEAKRDFQVDGGPATALHRAQVNLWMRALGQAFGELPVSLLDAAFRGAGPPPPQPVPQVALLGRPIGAAGGTGAAAGQPRG